MTPERLPEREIVPVPAEQLSPEGTAHHPLLEKAGFSPQLPARLKRLNDALNQAESSNLTALDIDFVPGQYPRIYIKPEFAQGVNVHLGSYPEHGTSAIEVVQRNVDLYGPYFDFTDIRDALASAFPGRKLTLRSKPNKAVLRLINIPEFEKDLADVTEREIIKLTEPLGGVAIDIKFLESTFTRKKSKSGISRRVKDVTGTVAQLYEHFRVEMVQGKSEEAVPTLTFFVLNPHGESVRCIFVKFNYIGKPEEVEGIIDPLADLFEGLIFPSPPKLENLQEA